MSKKLAAGLDALVLDVKTGSGAFLPDPAVSRFLAGLMVETGEAAGTRTVAVLTDMSQPLGHFIGNSVAVLEGLALLRGERHELARTSGRSHSSCRLDAAPLRASAKPRRKAALRAEASS